MVPEDQAKSKNGQTALTSGEAGIGKSRSVAGARACALAQRFLTLGNWVLSDFRTSPPFQLTWSPCSLLVALQEQLIGLFSSKSNAFDS
jgi:hypothetical protein